MVLETRIRTLHFLGYVSGVDFNVERNGDWFHTDPEPTDAYLLTQELAALKWQKKNEISVKRKEVMDGGMVFVGQLVSTDISSRDALTGAVEHTRGKGGETRNWRASDGTKVVLTGVQLKALHDAVGDHVQASYDRQFDLDDLIDVAVDEAAIAAIDIESGWPT